MSIVRLLRPDQRATRARVRTTACRGYVVELDPHAPGEPRLLENLRSGVVHFHSLDTVRTALRRRRVRYATLVQQHACEEVGALGVSDRPERGLTVLDDRQR
jgi:hypothetical protein